MTEEEEKKLNPPKQSKNAWLPIALVTLIIAAIVGFYWYKF